MRFWVLVAIAPGSQTDAYRPPAGLCPMGPPTITRRPRPVPRRALPGLRRDAARYGVRLDTR